MAISECDACGKFRPGSSGTDASGTDGFFCHVCSGDELDPYCEIEDAIEALESKLCALIRTAETGEQWAAIALIEARDLAPLLSLRAKANAARIMKKFDEVIALLRKGAR
jgi:hypothetical protein